MMDGSTRWKIVLAGIFVGIIRDDRNAFCAFGPNLMGDLRDGEPAFSRLSPGHRDRVVVKNLVGDVDACRRCRARGQQAGMGIGAAAEILKDGRSFGEGALADPGPAS